jgi:hypothetical protein
MEDMELMLRHMGGSSLSEHEIRTIATKVMIAAGVGSKGSMNFAEYKAAVAGMPINLHVEIPADD